MCDNNCTNTTRHALIFLFILFLLHLISPPNYIHYLPLPKTNHRPPPRPPPPIPFLPPCTDTHDGDIAVTSFLYGVLFTSITIIIIIITNQYWFNNSTTTDQDALEPTSASWSMFVGPTTTTTHAADIDSGGGGVGNDLIRTLPTFVYSWRRRGVRIGKGMRKCVICQRKYRDGQMLRWLPECDHLFHMICIDEWLISHKTCPCCRADLEVLPSQIYCYDHLNHPSYSSTYSC